MTSASSTSPVFSEDDLCLVASVTAALPRCGNPHAKRLEQAITEAADRLERLTGLMKEYPSLLGTQSLGGQKRDNSSLIDALSHATIFTVDMILPMRATMGQTCVMARLNFFRLLHQVVQEALCDDADFTRLEDAIGQRISQTIHTKVAESVLLAIVSDDTLPDTLRTRGAKALTLFWEDRFSKRIETFFPVLEATWEARRKISVRLGTLVGVEEIFSLMNAGGDHRFIDYFSRHTCSEKELQAFREFLFGLSTEHIESLNSLIENGHRTAFSSADADPSLSLPPSFLYNHSATDFVTRLYLFFVKRHLEALTRRVSDLPGPRRTAEEYVMIHFLEQECGEGK
ncbi:MAG: hypothetical protein FJY97_14405 [candidate division Zixibacteria bacterium]|nr:hypothetical protein [candidate division Zixibacteria bacterium]